MHVAKRKKSPEEVAQLAFAAFLQNDWDTFLKYVDTSTWDNIIPGTRPHHYLQTATTQSVS